MQWLEIAIMVKDAGADIMAEVLREKGVEIVSIESVKKQNFDDIIEWSGAKGQYESNTNEYMYVKAYFEYNKETSQDIIDYIKKRVEDIELMHLESIDLGECTVTHQVIDDEDWANDWKKFFKPMHITKNVVVKPSWEPYNKKDDEIVLVIDPGLAFGTGMHETTKMCMEFIEEYVKKGMTIADVGCGTGILSILAAKKGAKDIKAIDLDPVCIPIAKENAQVNNVQDSVEVIEGDLTEKLKDKVDIVIANIVATPVIEIIKNLDKILKPQGYFIASGIIDDRKQDVLDALEKEGLKLIEIKEEKVWVALVAQI